MSAHLERLARLAQMYGQSVDGELCLEADQPEPTCERDWILKIGDNNSLLFPVQCAVCNAGGYTELIGVTDPVRAAEIIETILLKEAEDDLLWAREVESWETTPVEPPAWTPSPDLDWSLEPGEEDI